MYQESSSEIILFGYYSFIHRIITVFYVVHGGRRRDLDQNTYF